MSNKIEITGRDLEVTERIREYVTQKMAKINRHLNAIEEIRIDLASVKTARSATDRYVAQLTVRGKNLLLRSEERADDIRTALDAALDKMTRQVARYKGKRDHSRGDGKSAAEVVPDIEPLPDMEAEEAAVILRRKQFDLIPMAEEEAIEQMKLLGHDNFFVFFNAQSGTINVLYHRRDGGYGLIEPRVR
ncbi:MAG: ribosomal subunit interface protein [Anaerolineae bacterium CG_4_9_14_3_um_filter_57_17]|nr:ribosome-associated translation inhibitor RaiA [bacterium]NCT21916.1 ribosome-associated translation inhibitor RaiA [bacterium]OIO84673.1 MAG: ribosomal subunit interface protein [Anaerolineae bacterium CG2_30_57_67]PJB65956.1 MAG: ribosomal subunit interface protein [Anaerolineae bacterium CG_4_9_14_3_um_filter_57_17]